MVMLGMLQLFIIFSSPSVVRRPCFLTIREGLARLVRVTLLDHLGVLDQAET